MSLAPGAPSRLPRRPTPGSSQSSPGHAAAAHQSLCCMWWCVHSRAALSAHRNLSFPRPVHTSVLYVCASIPALKVGSSASFSWIPCVCVRAFSFLTSHHLGPGQWLSTNLSCLLCMGLHFRKGFGELQNCFETGNEYILVHVAEKSPQLCSWAYKSSDAGF